MNEQKKKRGTRPKEKKRVLERKKKKKRTGGQAAGPARKLARVRAKKKYVGVGKKNGVETAKMDVSGKDGFETRRAKKRNGEIRRRKNMTKPYATEKRKKK